MPKILILGAAGCLGSALARALSSPERELVLVDRDARALERVAGAARGRAHSTDLAAPGALAALLTDRPLVLHCAGPFQGQSDALARACAEAGASYIDVADDRGYVERVRALDALAKQHGALLLTAGGTHAVLTAAAVEALEEEFAALNEIWIAWGLGTRSRLGDARIAGVLERAGKPFEMKLGGEWTTREVWGDERWAEFPNALGRRRVRNVDAPETLLLTERRRINMVRVSAALPVHLANRRLGFVRGLPGAGTPRGFRAWMGRLGWAGSDAAEVLCLWLRGTDNGRLPMERRVCFHGGDEQAALAAVPVLALVERVLSGPTLEPGARAALGLVPFDALCRRLAEAGVKETRGDLGGWRG
jgi:hypothetical protein